MNPRSVLTGSINTPAVPLPRVSGVTFNDWQPVIMFETSWPEAVAMATRIRLINEGEAPIEIRVMKSDTIDNAGTVGATPPYSDADYDLSGVITQEGANFNVVVGAWDEMVISPDKKYWRIDVRRLSTYGGTKPTWGILEIVTDDERVRRFNV